VDISNKRVCIVGPAKHIENLNDAELIDSYDVVIRFVGSLPLSDRLKQCVGSKTDIIISSEIPPRHIKDLDMVRRYSNVLMIPCTSTKASGPYAPINQSVNRLKKLDDIDLLLMDDELFKRIGQKVHTHPTTGFSALMQILSYNIAELYIVGFTFSHERVQEYVDYSNVTDARVLRDLETGWHNVTNEKFYFLKYIMADKRVKIDKYMKTTWGRGINELYSGLIYDAIHFDCKYNKPVVLNKNIKPIFELIAPIFGPVFTCEGAIVTDENEIDDTIRLKMFESFFDGCVQIISSGGCDGVAQFGDISGKIAKKHGAVAAIVEGPARDIQLIKQDEFPLFCDGAHPTDAFGKWQIINYKTSIRVRGVEGMVEINDGDYVFADNDGVIIIPGAIKNEVIDCAFKRLFRENQIRDAINEADDIVELNNKFGRW